jgi:hypothetical protein
MDKSATTERETTAHTTHTLATHRPHKHQSPRDAQCSAVQVCYRQHGRNNEAMPCMCNTTPIEARDAEQHSTRAFALCVVAFATAFTTLSLSHTQHSLLGAARRLWHVKVTVMGHLKFSTCKHQSFACPPHAACQTEARPPPASPRGPTCWLDWVKGCAHSSNFQKGFKFESPQP